MNHYICEKEATKEWLTLDSLDYIAECLEACENFDMLADLREIFPREALRVASSRVSANQRKNIILWLQQLSQSQAA